MQLSGYPTGFPWWFSDRITPVPIPNTAEKTAHSNNTWLARAWEDSLPPRAFLKLNSLVILYDEAV
jgi:hypothetical protein